MKSAHRHELQTNWLAHWLEVTIERFRPYVTTIAGVVLAFAVAVLVWSYLSRSSATHQGDAWTAYNEVIGSSMPNLEQLHESAQLYPGTKMRELSDITWADGQVLSASRSYILNRVAAKAAMERAVNVYLGILGSSKDQSLHDRAHLGLARVYEMRGDLQQAREEYLAVQGGYSAFAKGQAERLAKPEAKETYAWLEKAVPPRVPTAVGPGTPGKQPEFSASELELPEGAAAPGGSEPAVPATSIDELLEGLDKLPLQTGEGAGSQSAAPENPPAPETPVDSPRSEEAGSATGTSPTPPAAETKETNGAEDKAGE